MQLSLGLKPFAALISRRGLFFETTFYSPSSRYFLGLNTRTHASRSTSTHSIHSRKERPCYFVPPEFRKPQYQFLKPMRIFSVRTVSTMAATDRDVLPAKCVFKAYVLINAERILVLSPCITTLTSTTLSLGVTSATKEP